MDDSLWGDAQFDSVEDAFVFLVECAEATTGDEKKLALAEQVVGIFIDAVDQEKSSPHATLADLDDDTTARLHEGLQSLSELVRTLWYQCPNGDDIDALRVQADDIIRSIEAGLRPRKEAPHAE